MNSLVARLVGMVLILALLQGGPHPDREGFVYPDRLNLERHVSIGIYDSLKACRSAATRKLHQLHSYEDGDYECGSNCRLGPRSTIKVCDETLRKYWCLEWVTA